MIYKYIFKATLFCILFTLIFIILSFTKGYFPLELERTVHGFIGTVAALLTTFLFLKFDRKSFADINLLIQKDTLIKFFIGIVAGVVLMGVLALTIMYFSNVRIGLNDEGNFLHFIYITLPLLPLAFMEELGFRAYPLILLKDKVGIRPAIFITSILFALYHIANGWTVLTSFSGPAVWGLIFGLTAVYSKGIAMPTGLHYAANLTTAAFGTDDNTTSIWTIRPSSAQPFESVWWKILPAIALLVFAIFCIELYLRKRIV